MPPVTSFFQNLKLIPHIRLSVLRKVFSLMGQREKMFFLAMIFLALISGIFAITKLYSTYTTNAPAQGGNYREGIIGQPRFINPLLATTDTDRAIVKLVFSGLYKLDSTGSVVPDLAENMPTVSEDKQLYTVKLKQNAKWHNGTPVKADDVVFTIQTLQNAQYNSPQRSEWQSTTIEKIDDYTVSFKLNSPSAPFLNNGTCSFDNIT